MTDLLLSALCTCFLLLRLVSCRGCGGTAGDLSICHGDAAASGLLPFITGSIGAECGRRFCCRRLGGVNGCAPGPGFGVCSRNYGFVPEVLRQPLTLHRHLQPSQPTTYIGLLSVNSPSQSCHSEAQRCPHKINR